MSKKIGKREARNKLFDYAALVVQNLHIDDVFDAGESSNAVLEAERDYVAARIRKLISTPKSEAAEDSTAYYESASEAADTAP